MRIEPIVVDGMCEMAALIDDTGKIVAHMEVVPPQPYSEQFERDLQDSLPVMGDIADKVKRGVVIPPTDDVWTIDPIINGDTGMLVGGMLRRHGKMVAELGCDPQEASDANIQSIQNQAHRWGERMEGLKALTIAMREDGLSHEEIKALLNDCGINTGSDDE